MVANWSQNIFFLAHFKDNQPLLNLRKINSNKVIFSFNSVSTYNYLQEEKTSKK